MKGVIVMAIIIASILSTCIILPILIAACVIIFSYGIIAYITFCIGLKRFLIKNGLKTNLYWLPFYNLYLMGLVIDHEVGYKNKLLEYAKYIMPIGCIITYFITGNLSTVVCPIYFIYTLYVYYIFGKKYEYGLSTAILSIFKLQGINLLTITKKHLNKKDNYDY